jgi:hypothetical protein
MIVLPTALCSSFDRLCLTNLSHSCLSPVIVIRWPFRYFGSNSLFEVLISRVTLNNCKVSTIFFGSKRESSVSNFHLISQSSKILMYIILTHRILIFYKIVSMKWGGRKFWTMSFLELFKFACKNINQHRIYWIFISE